MKINRYPFRLKPVLKEIIWGGKRFASEYGKSDNPDQKIAESWELTVHKNGVNIIENGEYAGKSLEELFKLDKSIVSSDYESDKFPLLIKFIDAEQDLSVQVHPDDDYAGKYENEFGKTEMWYIINAKPGAKLVYGLNDIYSREDLQNLIDNGKFEDCLNYIEVKPGDVYFIPAGLVHAIGEGILIAEIQQNSDTTYRFYDYNRLGVNGKPRELHIKQALDVCIKTKTEYKYIREPYYEIYKIDSQYELLKSCEYFTVHKIKLFESLELIPNNSFNSILCIDGEGEILYNETLYSIKKGGSYFLPAGIERFKINKTSDNCVLLLTTLGNV
jgi:mannose-6-phosphate isomerase